MACVAGLSAKSNTSAVIAILPSVNALISIPPVCQDPSVTVAKAFIVVDPVIVNVTVSLFSAFDVPLITKAVFSASFTILSVISVASIASVGRVASLVTVFVACVAGLSAKSNTSAVIVILPSNNALISAVYVHTPPVTVAVLFKIFSGMSSSVIFNETVSPFSAFDVPLITTAACSTSFTLLSVIRGSSIPSVGATVSLTSVLVAGVAGLPAISVTSAVIVIVPSTQRLILAVYDQIPPVTVGFVVILFGGVDPSVIINVTV